MMKTLYLQPSLQTRKMPAQSVVAPAQALRLAVRDQVASPMIMIPDTGTDLIQKRRTEPCGAGGLSSQASNRKTL